MKKVTNKVVGRRDNIGLLMNIDKYKTALLEFKQSLLQAQETGDEAEQSESRGEAHSGVIEGAPAGGKARAHVVARYRGGT